MSLKDAERTLKAMGKTVKQNTPGPAQLWEGFKETQRPALPFTIGIVLILLFGEPLSYWLTHGDPISHSTMTALQWAGLLGTLGGYALLVYRSRLWGAVLSFAGVTALGLWAALVGAWPVVGLEVAFMAINAHIIIQESRHGH